MELLLCGGFLGSGKTTLINKLLHGITEQGLTVALIENEACQEGIDAALTGQEGIKVVPLFGGCVCCQLSGSLLETVQKLEAELSPDWVVVELTGLAMMDNIREVFRMYAPKDLTARLHTLAVADMVHDDAVILVGAVPDVHNFLSVHRLREDLILLEKLFHIEYYLVEKLVYLFHLVASYGSGKFFGFNFCRCNHFSSPRSEISPPDAGGMQAAA